MLRDRECGRERRIPCLRADRAGRAGREDARTGGSVRTHAPQVRATRAHCPTRHARRGYRAAKARTGSPLRQQPVVVDRIQSLRKLV